MFDVSTCPQIFAEKLLKEKSFDAAIKKIVWQAYLQGHEDAKNNIPIHVPIPDAGEWDEERMEIVGQNGNVGYSLEDMN